MRVDANRARKISVTLDDDEGFAKKTTGGDVRADVKRPDGTVVLASTVATDEGQGVYSFTLPAQAQLDELVCTWTVTGSLARVVTDKIVVVARRLLTLERLRKDRELKEKRTPILERVRDAVEERFKDALGFPAVPSPARVSVHATSSPLLNLSGDGVHRPLTFYSGTQGSEAITVADLRGTFGGVEWSDRRSWTPSAIVSLWLTHGFAWAADGQPPEDLVEAGAIYARYLTRESKLSERAIRVSTEGSDILLGSANKDRPTGLPDVDAVLTGYRVEAVV